MTELRRQFPILERRINGAPLTYLDNAATTQKPACVIDAIADYYQRYNSNVHRAAHALADEATAALESVRGKVQRFIDAASVEEIVFTRGTTESINLVAACLTSRLEPDDEILITELEHHSNIVPWQMLAARTGARLRAVAVTSDGELDTADLHAKLGPRTRLVALGHVSNALGTRNDVQGVVAAAHAVGALVLIDGAQAMAHLEVSVTALDCDFYAFSGHKMFGPTGIGVLYGRRALLEQLPPWQGGGEMIEHVTIEHTTWNALPWKFEAGTPNIAGIVGLGAAIDWLTSLPRADLLRTEDQLVRRTVDRLKQTPGIRIVGEPRNRIGVVSFLAEGAHPNDIGTLLDQQGVAVRTGHHCAMPLMARLGVPGTVRASLGLYNDENDVDRLIEGLEKALSFM
jgi:SufS family cysteine desulfurase